MIVCSWSHIHGQVATTSNLCAIAIHLAMTRKVKCAVLQTQSSLNPLEEALVERNHHASASEDFSEIGTEALLRIASSRDLTAMDITERVLPILSNKGSVALIPIHKKSDYSVFQSDLADDKKLNRLLSALGSYFDYVFVDVNSGNGALTMKIKEASDFVLVNLSQNQLALKDYFERFEQTKNMFYVFGLYDSKSRYNLRNLRQLYKGFLNARNCGVIPYNIEFKDAMSDHKLIRFLCKNSTNDKGEFNSEFSTNLEETVNKFIQFTGGNFNDT